MDKTQAKRILDSAYRAFVKNPSAANYIVLQQRMLICPTQPNPDRRRDRDRYLPTRGRLVGAP